MRSVNVAKLKNSSSKCITYAKAGEEAVIRDRNLSFAKLVPFLATGADDLDIAFVASEKIRLLDRYALRAVRVERKVARFCWLYKCKFRRGFRDAGAPPAVYRRDK